MTTAKKPRQRTRPAASKAQAASRRRKPVPSTARAATSSEPAPQRAGLVAPVQDVRAVAKYQTELTAAQLRLITDLGQVQANLVREVAHALRPDRS